MAITGHEVQRRPYLDGLRGVAACMVFFAHLTIAMLPAVVTFNPGEAHTRWDVLLGLTPLSLIWAGNFAVCIFFVLSGFVLAGFCTTVRISFPAQLVRRYLRLALPMLITSALAGLIMMLGLTKNLDASTEVTHSGWLSMWYRAFTPGVVDVVIDSFYGAFRHGKSNYNSNLWTMQIELYGSAGVFMVYALFHNKAVRVAVLLGLAIAHHKDYYSLFAVGVLLSELDAVLVSALHRLFAPVALRQGVMLAAFLVGLFFGAFPFIQPGMQAPLYSWISRSSDAIGWHMIGAILLVAGLLHSSAAQRWLGSRLGRYLGRLSFVLYLIHLPIICSFTAWVCFWMRGVYYPATILVAGGSSIILVFGVSTLLYRYVDVHTTAFSRLAGLAFDRWFPAAGTWPSWRFASKADPAARSSS